MKTVGLFLLFCCLSANTSDAQNPSTSDAESWNQFRSLGDWWRYQSIQGTSPDGTQILLGGHSKQLAFYDLTLGRVTRMLTTREGMQSATLSPDGKLLATAEWRDGFAIRDANSFAVLKTFSGSGGLGAWQARFSPDGRQLLCYSWWRSEKQFFRYDIESKTIVDWPAYRHIETDQSYVRERIGRSTNHLLSVQNPRTQDRPEGYRVWVTDPMTGTSSNKLPIGANDTKPFSLSPDGRRLIVYQLGNPVRVINVQTGETLVTLANRNWITGAAFSPDGQRIATVRGTVIRNLIATDKRPHPGAPANIVLHDANTGAELARHERLSVRRNYYGVGFSADGNYVFSITSEKDSRREVVLWGNLPNIPETIDPLPTFENAKTPPAAPQRTPINIPVSAP